MGFHYTREPGPEGAVLTTDGDADGQTLADLQAGQPIPIRAALELTGAIADILTVAEEDRAVHGDLSPDWVVVGKDGSVSLNGYGSSRRGRAPESRPAGVRTDTYGLGVVMHAALSGEVLGETPRGADAHDDAIVTALLAIDWRSLAGRPWFGEVRHFLCSMLSHDPDQRPDPLDVANVLIGVAARTEGQDLEAWARAVHGGPTRVPATRPPADETLSRPRAVETPMSQTQALRVRKAASSRGQETQIWSREKIAALFEDDEPAPPRPRTPEQFRFTPPASLTPPDEPPTSEAAPPAPDPWNEPPPAPITRGRADMGPPARGAPPPKSSSPPLSLILAVVAVLMLAVAVCSGSAVALYLLREDAPPPVAPARPSAEEAVPSEPEPQPEPVQAVDPPEATAPRPAPPKPRAPRPAAPAPAEPAPTPEEAAPSSSAGPFDVTLTLEEGQARIQCGDGQETSFAGSTKMSFREVTTCRLKSDEAMGVIQVSSSAELLCRSGFGRIQCSPR